VLTVSMKLVVLLEKGLAWSLRDDFRYYLKFLTMKLSVGRITSYLRVDTDDVSCVDGQQATVKEIVQVRPKQ